MCLFGGGGVDDRLKIITLSWWFRLMSFFEGGGPTENQGSPRSGSASWPVGVLFQYLRMFSQASVVWIWN